MRCCRKRRIARHLGNTFKPNNIQYSITPKAQLEPRELLRFFSSKEVEATIDKLNPNNVPGLDRNIARVLKKFFRKAICRLVKIFNAIICLRYFPKVDNVGQTWQATGQAIGLSLYYPSYSCSFEKLLHKRLLSLITQGNIIPEH